MNENHLSIVLRAADYKDNDKMLTLITANKGKVSALARGIRKQNNALFGLGEVFSCSEFGFYIKNDRYIITQGILKNGFFNIRTDYEAMAAASFICELCEYSLTEEEPNPRLFALTASALFALDNGIKPENAIFFFMIKLLDILGLRPDTSSCIVCGNKAANKVNTAHGGFVCDNCEGIIVKNKLKIQIDQILTTSSKNILSTDLVIDQTEFDLLTDWIINAIGKTPKSVSMVKNIFFKKTR